jgi:hypothetical protein
MRDKYPLPNQNRPEKWATSIRSQSLLDNTPENTMIDTSFEDSVIKAIYRVEEKDGLEFFSRGLAALDQMVEEGKYDAGSPPRRKWYRSKNPKHLTKKLFADPIANREHGTNQCDPITSPEDARHDDEQDALKLSKENARKGISIRSKGDKQPSRYVGDDDHVSLPEYITYGQEDDNSLVEPPAKVVAESEVDVAESERSSSTGLLMGEAMQNASFYIDDYHEVKFKDITGKLYECTTLKKVEIHRLREGDKKKTRSLRELRAFFLAIRRLPMLATLNLRNFDEEDLESFSKTVTNHPSLKKIKLHLGNGTLNEPTMKALSSVSNLLEVELDVNHSFPLGSLLKSKTMSTLRIISEHFQFQDDHFLSMFEHLEDNKTLKSMDLSPRISAFALKVLTYSLRANKTLENLHFSYVGKYEKADSSLVHVAKALKVNSTLKTLWNYSYASVRVREKSKDAMLRSLAKNHTVASFHFFDEDKDFWEEKGILLEQNEAQKTLGSDWSLLPFSLLCPCSTDF